MDSPLTFIRNDITYTLAFPDDPVRVFVDHFVVMSGQAAMHENRIFPNNKAELFFNLADPLAGKPHGCADTYRLKESVISGTRHSYFSFQPGVQLLAAGLRFTLFGFYHLFQIPACEFTNGNFNTTDVWGREMEWLRERLLACDTPQNLFAVLYAWVLDKISDEKLREIKKWTWVEKQIMQPHTQVEPLLARIVGYSHKHTIQLFKEKAGLSPKTIQRVNRFESALRQINRKAPVDWIGLANEAGYSDQSHFIREFSHFTGYTPGAYLRESPPTLRLPLQAEDNT